MNTFKCKGFRVIHIPTVGTSDIVNIRFIANVGSGNEPGDHHGSAHFLEHMFFKGTPKWNWKDLNYLTAKLGATNAYTSHMRTAYHLSFRKRDLLPATECLSEMIFNASLPEDEFEKETGVIVEEWQMYEAQPTSYCFSRFFEDLFGQPFGHDVIGTGDSIKATTTDKLRFIRSFYNPANMIIAVAGNVTEDEVRSVLDKYVPETGPAPATRNPHELNLEDIDLHHVSQQAIIALATESVTTQDDASVRHIVDIFDNGFGGQQHSMLYNRLREELGLCYAVHGYHWSTEIFGTAITYSLVSEENADQALEEINGVIKQVRTEGFGDELLEICKSNYLFRFSQRIETTSGLNSLVDAYFSLGDRPLDKFLSLEERTKSIEAITNDDIIEFANRVFDPNKPTKVGRMTQER